VAATTCFSTYKDTKNPRDNQIKRQQKSFFLPLAVEEEKQPRHKVPVTFMSGTNNICIFNVKTEKSEKKFGR